jgi:hypothetical protein
MLEQIVEIARSNGSSSQSSVLGACRWHSRILAIVATTIENHCAAGDERCLNRVV